QRVIVDGGIGQARRDASAGGAAELHGFELAAVLDAAANHLDHFANSYAHGDFDQAAAVDLTRQRKNLGSGAGGGAARGERRGAVANDPGDAGERLHVVDDGGVAAKSALDGIGGPQPGHAALALEGLDERRLFTADKSAGALANLEAQLHQEAAL